MTTPAKLRADWIFTGEELLHDAIISFRPWGEGASAPDFGTILEIREYDAEEDHSYQYLKDRLIIPGLLNAHSHAFQRAIRGRTYAVDLTGDRDSFWSWRAQMYRAANALDEEGVFAVSRVAFLEMIASGYTSVGEFHYLQRPSETAANGRFEGFAEAVIAAAREVGLRITLINTAYQGAAPGLPASPEQHRFTYDQLDTFLDATTALHQKYLDDPIVSVAIAAHSIRALQPDAIRACHEHAVQLDIPFHIHACEQRKELVQSREAYGVEPIEFLDNLGALTQRTAIVHGTHLAAGDIARLSASGACVVACPTTERDLGDGFLPATDLLTAEIPVAIGSDSHATISPFEELRAIEYHERLLHEGRNLLAKPLRKRCLAEGLFGYVQNGGNHALRCKRGFLKPSYAADFFSLDLNHPMLWGVTSGDLSNDGSLLSEKERLGSLMAGVLFSADSSVVDRVWVNGVECRERLFGDYLTLCREEFEAALKSIQG